MDWKESSFVEKLRKRCQAFPGRIALPEITDIRVLGAAIHLLKVGAVKKVHTLTPNSVLAALKIPADLRKDFASFEDDQGQVSLEQKSLFQSGELLQKGIVDTVVAGATHTTAEVIRSAISTVGLRSGCRTVSGSFLMNRGDSTYLFADCGVVIDPNPKQLDDIADMSLETWRKVMGEQIDPVVAFLSFSTKGSAAHERAERMAKAAEEFKKRHPDVDCDGEMQFDAAFDKVIGEKKSPGSPVPGRANCFIFPNLDAGNLAYKMTQRLANFEAFGPILQGAGKSFSDLSRGSSTGDIIAASYINLIRAT